MNLFYVRTVGTLHAAICPIGMLQSIHDSDSFYPYGKREAANDITSLHT